MDRDGQAEAYHAELLARQLRTIEVLERALKRGTDPEDIKFIAIELGVWKYLKGEKNAKH